MQNEKRLAVQVDYDVLRAVHLRRRAGKNPTSYEIERLTAVPHQRMRDRLGELNDAGFMSLDLNLTERGYMFIQDIAKIVPVLKRYGYWRED